MDLLVIGGSGLVGSIIVPALAQRHVVRVFDVRPSGDSGVDYVAGSVEDFDALRQASTGMDAVCYLAMNPKRGWGSPASVGAAFDVNVKGVYLALWAAAEEGVRHALYASSLNVCRSRDRYPDEDDAPDADAFYGFTKRLGEDACPHAAGSRGMSVNALRLCHPTPDDEWPLAGDSKKATISTCGSDVAAAFEAALHYRDGFQAFTISGDSDERVTGLGKAKKLLNWTPTPRPPS